MNVDFFIERKDFCLCSNCVNKIQLDKWSTYKRNYSRQKKTASHANIAVRNIVLLCMEASVHFIIFDFKISAVHFMIETSGEYLNAKGQGKQSFWLDFDKTIEFWTFENSFEF